MEAVQRRLVRRTAMSCQMEEGISPSRNPRLRIGAPPRGLPRSTTQPIGRLCQVDYRPRFPLLRVGYEEAREFASFIVPHATPVRVSDVHDIAKTGMVPCSEGAVGVRQDIIDYGLTGIVEFSRSAPGERKRRAVPTTVFGETPSCRGEPTSSIIAGFRVVIRSLGFRGLWLQRSASKVMKASSYAGSRFGGCDLTI